MDKRDLTSLQIQFIKGVGPRRAALLKRLGITTVYDALTCFPQRYEDRMNVCSVRQLNAGATCTVLGEVVSAENVTAGRRGRRLLKIFVLTITDGTGLIKAKWFNQPYMKKRFKVGARVVLSGAVKYGYKGAGLEIDNPEYELLGAEGEDDTLVHTARIVPVYGTTEGLSTKQLRTIIHNVVEAHADELGECLPEDIRQRHGLPGITESVRSCHFPPAEADVELLNSWRTPWQRRVLFEELFMLELGLASMKQGKGAEPGIAFQPGGELIEKFLDALPFKLTEAQGRVFQEILSDMKTPHPMHRLMQGDVGSGKTVVALMAAISAVQCGYQAALMAPTEILAAQHYISIHRMVEGLGLDIALLMGSTRDRPLKQIEAGEVDIVVGTHALIQEGVRFKRLGLAIIDEQHRFGVMQRAVLRQKASNPDVLVMTATPIPRTLAMTLYGDLDCSVIDEMPPGRTPVRTRIVMADEKASAYETIRQEVDSGGQVYVVYPIIEESEKTLLRSAELGHEALAKMFAGYRVKLIHGRMKPAEREAVMDGFKGGEIDILVSTTVIEVGVDVPRASLMLIVHAERFGLSQLHQLRGRVGRGLRRSTCLLLAYGPLGDEARRRLDIMVASTDGFAIAEEDLAIRGPGEVMGTRQAGLPDLRVANLVRDAGLLQPARAEAFDLVGRDPLLQSEPVLRAAAEKFWHGRVEIFKTA